MKMKHKDRWLPEPEKQDYPAAESYLSLLYDEKRAAALVRRLRAAPMTKFKAKDISRASRLPLLGVNNAHVKADQDKLLHGKPISPLLLVRRRNLAEVVIADGYHRICAVYSIDEDAVIPCKIVSG